MGGSQSCDQVSGNFERVVEGRFGLGVYCDRETKVLDEYVPFMGTNQPLQYESRALQVNWSIFLAWFVHLHLNVKPEPVNTRCTKGLN